MKIITKSGIEKHIGCENISSVFDAKSFTFAFDSENT